MDEQDAVRALEAMQATRRRMAGRARWSFGRHAAFGLVMGGLIASYALPAAWPTVGLAVCIAATGAIIARDRRRDGFFVSGYRPGRTRALTLVLCLVAAAALILAMVLRTRFELWWAPLAIGAGVACFATAGSIAWERIYRRELESAGDGD